MLNGRESEWEFTYYLADSSSRTVFKHKLSLMNYIVERKWQWLGLNGNSTLGTSSVKKIINES